MRRELLVLLGVLVPFAALVALGFWFLEAPATPGATVVNQASPPPPPPPPPPTARPPPPVVVAPIDAGEEALPEAIAAPIRALDAEFRRCFDDQRARAQGPVEVTLAFRPTPDGGFAETSLRSSWQDPYLTACLEDVLAEVTFTPTGRETFRPTTHVFHFDRVLRHP